MFDCGRNEFPQLAPQNPPHPANFIFQVFLALCGGQCSAAGGVPPTNLLPSHMAEDKKQWHLKSVSNHCISSYVSFYEWKNIYREYFSYFGLYGVAGPRPLSNIHVFNRQVSTPPWETARAVLPGEGILAISLQKFPLISEGKCARIVFEVHQISCHAWPLKGTIKCFPYFKSVQSVRKTCSVAPRNMCKYSYICCGLKY